MTKRRDDSDKVILITENVHVFHNLEPFFCYLRITIRHSSFFVILLITLLLILKEFEPLLTTIPNRARWLNTRYHYALVYIIYM
jgi:hypothetical protein